MCVLAAQESESDMPVVYNVGEIERERKCVSEIC